MMGTSRAMDVKGCAIFPNVRAIIEAEMSACYLFKDIFKNIF